MIADSFIVYRIVLHKCCNKYNNSTNKQKKNKEKVQVSVVFPSFLFGNSSSSYELLEKKHDILNLFFLILFFFLSKDYSAVYYKDQQLF